MRVIFPIEKQVGGNLIVYPDDISLFSNTTETADGLSMVADYSGALSLTPYSGEALVNANGYRTRVSNGELIVLLEKQAFAKIHRAAYPPGNQTPDDEALYFFERGRYPTDDDGLIDVTSATMTTALDYFITQGYMTASDKERVQLGMPL